MSTNSFYCEANIGLSVFLRPTMCTNQQTGHVIRVLTTHPHYLVLSHRLVEGGISTSTTSSNIGVIFFLLFQNQITVLGKQYPLFSLLILFSPFLSSFFPLTTFWDLATPIPSLSLLFLDDVCLVVLRHNGCFSFNLY